MGFKLSGFTLEVIQSLSSSDLAASGPKHGVISKASIYPYVKTPLQHVGDTTRGIGETFQPRMNPGPPLFLYDEMVISMFKNIGIGIGWQAASRELKFL